MTESEDAPSANVSEDILKVATDRLVWIRLLEKAVNDIDGVLKGLRNDIAEISMAMQARDKPAEEPVEEDE